MRTPTSLIVLIVLLQALQLVGAAEKKIAGKITAVDADNRSITVEAVHLDSDHERSFDWGRDRLTVTIDVIRKTKITVEGASARFADIMVGQSANVIYDDKLEFATVIAVRESLGRDEEKTAADMKALQGNWVCIAEEEVRGQKLDDEAVKGRERRVTISRNNFLMIRTLDHKRGAFTGKFDIDAATGQFDFIGKDPNGHLSEWIGIYEIKDDTWKVRYNFKHPHQSVRPAKLELDQDEVEKSRSRMYVFKREVD